MGCGCGGGAKTARAGRALTTSGDVAAGMVGAQNGNRAVTPAADEPLLMVRLDGGDHDAPIPPEARFRVTSGATVAYFGGHGGAFAWQQANGGKLRTVRH